ncbi:hypothetical protein CEE37_06005 [candidate division LCP-89 bacterium B3_LCP]|uniref:Secretion system C-terminal sorting domain-containing protein n=1 Tax=candidate division LCP-89 bacterium B3_LCP TaxID=2012998 RepID=A0A532V1X8_UNCL8|nr:MAG: hypothetical protein CEE37_06005 [candidate division LCP-89 bacterium B3_LCP]
MRKSRPILFSAEGNMKNLRIVLLVFAILIQLCLFKTFQQANAQVYEQWVTKYNGLGIGVDYAQSLAIDRNGNAYVTGHSYVNGINSDYATIKYDSAGVEQWFARYNGPANYLCDIAKSLAVDADGNVYVTGYSEGSGTDADYATIKYAPTGIEQWVARYNGPGNGPDQAYSLAVDLDGNVYVTGASIGSSTGWDYTTIKYDSAGIEQWVATYNGPGNGSDQANSLAVDPSGNVFITGRSDGSGASNDLATIKYGIDGSELWVARYSSPVLGCDVPSSLYIDVDGNVYVTAASGGIETGLDYVTIKYDPRGFELWVVRYNGPENGDDCSTSLDVDSDGSVYVTGFSEGSGTDWDYATIKYDPNGIEQWEARYNGLGNSLDLAYSLAVDGDGSVYVTGLSEGNGTYYDYATVKYDNNGFELWVARFNGPGNFDDGAQSLAVSAEGNVYVTGYSDGSGTNYDYATIKYTQIYNPYFAIDLIPFSVPIQIPASGGSFEYYLFAANNIGDPSAADMWIDAILPSGSGHDLLLGPVSVNLNPGTTSWHRTQTVPGTAPSGQYQYIAHIGFYPYLTWDCDFLEFVKLDTGGVSLLDDFNNVNECFDILSAEETPALPEIYEVLGAYPNPFNPATALSYKLPNACIVNLLVYDVSGRLVTELVNGWRDAGTHEVTFDGSNLVSGIYIYNLTAGDYKASGKMVLMK